MTPLLPIVETHVRDYSGGGPDELIVALSKDSAGVWWHYVGGEAVRPATSMETLLPLSRRAWKALGTPTANKEDGQ